MGDMFRTMLGAGRIDGLPPHIWSQLNNFRQQSDTLDFVRSMVPYLPPAVKGIARKILERSAKNPLVLDLEVPADERYAYETICETSKRISSLSVTLNFRQLKSFLARNGSIPLPVPKNLAINCDDLLLYSERDAPSQLFSDAQQLESFSFRPSTHSDPPIPASFWRYMGIPYARLTKLKLWSTIFPEGMFFLLTACENLVGCSITIGDKLEERQAQGIVSLSPSKHLVHPRLESLMVIFDLGKENKEITFLRHLTLPSLSCFEMDVAYTIDSTGLSLDEIFALFTRSACRLKRLSTGYNVELKHPQDVLLKLPLLESFHGSFDVSKLLIEDMASGNLGAHLPELGRGDPGCSLSPTNANAFVEMVKKRWSQESPGLRYIQVDVTEEVSESKGEGDEEDELEEDDKEGSAEEHEGNENYEDNEDEEHPSPAEELRTRLCSLRNALGVEGVTRFEIGDF